MGTPPSPLSSIVLILGDAEPLVERAATEVVREGLAKCGIPAFNHGRYRAGDSALSAVAAARTPPMMADVRLVEVRGLHEATPTELEALVEYAAKPSPQTVLLLVGRGLPKSVKGQPNFGIRLRNAVKKVGRLVEHKTESVNLPRFASEVAKGLGKKLAPQDAEVLVQWLGGDVGRLQSEVQKLALFVGDSPMITADDVREGSALLGEAEIWSLTGAIAARDVNRALSTLHRLLSSGEDPRKLLGMIAWQMREIVKVSEWVEAGLADSDIRKRGRIRFDVLKAVRMAGDRAPVAATAMSQLARANRAMNAHKAGDARVIEELVLELCA